jgi:hypothetical protein
MGCVWRVLTLERLRELSDEQVAQLANERLIPLDIPPSWRSASDVTRRHPHGSIQVPSC